MRTSAKIDKFILFINRYLGFFIGRIPVLIHPAFFKPFNQLDFIRLIGKNLLCLFRTDDFLYEGVIALDNFFHPMFDLFQIFGRQRSRKIKIIVETVRDCRSDRHFSFGKFFKDSLRHNMGSGMPDFIQFRILVFSVMFCSHISSVIKIKKTHPITGASL